jgi:hypothetical protein
VRRALVLLEGGRWVRARLPARGRPMASVQLSQYSGDTVPIGMDVLRLLLDASYVVEGRKLPGGDWRYDLTDAGRVAAAAGVTPAAQ